MLSVILKAIEEIKKSQDVGVNVGINAELNKLLILIERNPGVKVKQLYDFIENKNRRTIERYLAKLKQ